MKKLEVCELRIAQELASFAFEMQWKLDLNSEKECDQMNPKKEGRSWKKCKADWLLFRLREETLELEKAIACGTKEEIKREAADVGNFAMFIFDTAKQNRRVK